MKILLLTTLVVGLLISCTNTPKNTEKEITSTTQKTVAEPLKKPISDCSKKNIKGGVKERKVWVYASDTIGNPNKEALRGGIEVQYNQVGNRLIWQSYGDKKQLVEKQKYFYSEEGLLKMLKIEQGAVVRELHYRYNAQQQLEQSLERVSGTKVKTSTYQYDEQGNLQSLYSFVLPTESESKQVYSYNAKNELVEVQVYDEQAIVQMKRRFVYNEQGQEIEQAIYSGTNSPSYKRQMAYDEQGNCIKDWAYLEDGKLNAKDAFNYNYTYDEQGNWITKVKKTTTGKALEHSIQTLVYF